MELKNKQPNGDIMTTEVLASKTGLTGMGGYWKEVTIQVYTHIFGIESIDKKPVYRFRYVGDSYDYFFYTLDEAMAKFNEVSKWMK